MPNIVDEDGKTYKYTLITVEGPDGVGKSTVVASMVSQLRDEEGVHYIYQHFPNHEVLANTYPQTEALATESYKTTTVSSPVIDYLNGKINIAGNPWAVAHLYTQDRLLTWTQDHYLSPIEPCLRQRILDIFHDHPNDELVVIFDRYTQSSEIYQGADMTKEECDKFCEWLENYEYNTLGLPRPDFVIYLDGDTEKIIESKNHRASVLGGKMDIHEADDNYMRDCMVNGRWLSVKRQWYYHQYLSRKGEFDDPNETARDIIKLTRGELNERFDI